MIQGHGLVRVQQPEDLHGRRQEFFGKGLVGQSVGLALGCPFSFELGELLLERRLDGDLPLRLVDLSTSIRVDLRESRAEPPRHQHIL